ncbi:MAG: hypothetical protein M3M97_06240 [Actinomycetota bacterium]|nr:hypothetical protein [Actinomycetota bacterium]
MDVATTAQIVTAASNIIFAGVVGIGCRRERVPPDAPAQGEDTAPPVGTPRRAVPPDAPRTQEPPPSPSEQPPR